MPRLEQGKVVFPEGGSVLLEGDAVKEAYEDYRNKNIVM